MLVHPSVQKAGIGLLLHFLLLGAIDAEPWGKEQELHIFIQMTGQGDGERTENIPPQMASVLEWNPNQEL